MNNTKDLESQLGQTRQAVRDLREFTDRLNEERERLFKDCLSDSVAAAIQLTFIDAQLLSAKTIQSCLNSSLTEAKFRIRTNERREERLIGKRQRQPAI